MSFIRRPRGQALTAGFRGARSRDARWAWWWRNYTDMFLVASRNGSFNDLSTRVETACASGGGNLSNNINPAIVTSDWGVGMASGGGFNLGNWTSPPKYFYGPNEARTIGAIFTIWTANTGFGSILTTGASSFELATTNGTLQSLELNRAGTVTQLTTVAPVSPNSIFVAVAYDGPTNANNVRFILKDLRTGAVIYKTFSDAISCGNGSSQYQVFRSSFYNTFNGWIHLAAVQRAGLSRDQLYQWANDPYGPYYNDYDDEEQDEWFVGVTTADIAQVFFSGTASDTFTGAVVGGKLFTGSSIITATPSLIGVEAIIGSSLIDFSSGAIPTLVASSTIEGESAVSASGEVIGLELISGAGTISPDGSSYSIGSSNIGGSALVSSIANVVAQSFIEGDTIVVAGGQVVGDGSIFGTSILFVNGQNYAVGAVDISGTSTLSASRAGFDTGTVGFSATSVLAATGDLSANVAVFGTSDLIVNGESSGIGVVNISGSSTISLVPRVTASIVLTGESGVTGSPVLISAVNANGNSAAFFGASLVAHAHVDGDSSLFANSPHLFDGGQIDIGGSSAFTAEKTVEIPFIPRSWPPVTVPDVDDYARPSDFATAAGGPQQFATLTNGSKQISGRSQIRGKKNPLNPFRKG